MAKVSVTFNVSDVHVGTDPDEWRTRVTSELNRIAKNSETGLVLDNLSSPTFTDMPNQKLQERRMIRETQSEMRKMCKKKIISRRK